MGEDVGIGYVVNAGYGYDAVHLSQCVEHGDVGGRHTYDVLGSGRDGRSGESCGGELTIAGDEVGHCYIFGSLPRVGYLYQGALGILCAQYLESGSIFGRVYVLLECFQRSFFIVYAACQKKEA